MIPNIPIPVVATPIDCSNPSSVGLAICGYAVTIIPKPRIPMPVARSDIQLIFSSCISCCIIVVGHMIYYPKLDYNGVNVSCEWLEFNLTPENGLFEGGMKQVTRG
jgi:hypothetical protein